MNWQDVTATLLSNTPTLIVLLTVGLVLLKKNKLSYKGHGLTVGGDEAERKVLRDQFTLLRSKCEAFVTDPAFASFDEYKVKYIGQKVQDILEESALFNHLTLQGSYIRVKQELILSAILKRTNNELVRSQEFQDRVRKEVQELFEQLISIRESYRS